MSAIVFYSWQSDIRAAACRTLIQTALEEAARDIAKDATIAVEPVIDRDVLGIPGSPDIGATILAKIDASAVFVADVTIVGKTDEGKPLPNPNVLLELGYALKALGSERVLLVQNTAFGGPEDLPFDLRQKLAIVFSSPADAGERAPVRRALRGKLTAALRQILDVPKKSVAPEIELKLTFAADKTGQDYHHYQVTPWIKNVGKRRIDDWQLELEFPTFFIDRVVYGLKAGQRSTKTHTLFHRDGRNPESKQPLYPNAEASFSIGYEIRSETFWANQNLFDGLVVVRALVDGAEVAVVERPFRELQNF